MGIKDIERIMKGLPQSEVEELPEEKLPLLLDIAGWAANAMLSRILGLFGLDEEAAELLWNWVSNLWNSLLSKLAPGNYYFREAQNIYKRRMERALRAYLNGKEDLVEALLSDLIGGE